MADPDLLVEIAGRVSDGETVNWDAVRRRSADAQQLALVDALQLVETLVRAHQTTSGGAVPGPERDDLGRLSGTMTAGYVLLDRLGRGGMGDVYRGWDPRLGRQVAVKVLSPELAGDELARKRFVRETRHACQVVHPYIATVFDVVEHGREILLVMELIQGEGLAAWARADRNPEQVQRVASEIVEALRAIHDADLVHRDMKPGNVMVTGTGHVKVMDFGIAIRVHARPVSGDPTRPSDDVVTREGRSVGTIAYMSPEQIRAEPVDRRSDLFSLGIVLWELFAGVHPFARGTALETASAILHEPPAGGPAAIAAKAGPWVPIVLELLQKDRARRPADARLVVERVGTHPGASPPAKLRARGRPHARWAAVALGLLLAGAAAWKLREHIGVPGAARTRPLAVIVPFETAADLDDGTDLGERIADWAAAALSESGRITVLDPERVVEIVRAGDGPTQQEAVVALLRKTGADWIVRGRVWREGEVYLAAVQLWLGDRDEAPESFQARGAYASMIADATAARLLAAAGGDGASQGAAAQTHPDSEEVRTLVHRARQAARELRYADAIALLERAATLAPESVAVQRWLAEHLSEAGYTRRARRAADRMKLLAETAGLPERSALDVTATHARVHARAAEELRALRALRSLAPEDAALHLAAGRRFAAVGDSAEALDALTRASLYDANDPRINLERGRILSRLGRPKEARAALERAEGLADSLRSAPLQAAILQARGALEVRAGNYPEAERFYARAVQRLEGTDERIRSLAAELALLDARVVQGKLAAVAGRHEALIATLRAAGNVGLALQSRAMFGAQLGQRGEFERAESELRLVLGDAREAGNPSAELYATLNLAGIVGYTGRPVESEALALQALSRARELGDRNAEAKALTAAADAAFQLGRTRAALDNFDAIVALRSAADAPKDDLGYVHASRAEALEVLGRLGDARDAAELARSTDQEQGQTLAAAYDSVLLARMEAALGGWDQADRALDEAQSALKKIGSEQAADLQARIHLARAWAGVLEGDSAKAANELDAALRGPGKDGLGGWPAFLGCAIASIGGNRERAAADCGTAVHEPQLMSNQRGWSRTALASALVGSGRLEEGEREARGALDDASRREDPLVEARAAAVLLGPEFGRRHDEALAGRARGALERLVASAPPQRRAALRRRTDIAAIEYATTAL